MYFPVPNIPQEKKRELGDWPVIVPKGIQRDGVWIPKRFKDAILLHIAKNYTSCLSPALILAIQGRAGEGKTFQTRETCSQLGIYVVPVSGALLSGRHEKDAVEVLQRVYVFASLVRHETRRMTVLLIDDFDLSVASTFGNRTYTVNSQLLSGFLMNLTDDPTRCGSETTYRIPIIVTGNDFTALHTPLIRHGRMYFFDWKPTSEEKVSIVSTIFASVLKPKELPKLRNFVAAYLTQPISFFASLREALVDEAILQLVEREREINPTSIEYLAPKILQNQTVEALESLAIKRQAAIAKDFLGRDEYGRDNDGSGN